VYTEELLGMAALPDRAREAALDSASQPLVSI